MDALAYKNLVLEWAQQRWVRGLVNNLDEVTAVNLSLFNPELFETRNLYSPGYPAIDVSAALQRGKILHRREQYVASQLVEFAKAENSKIYAEVEKMLQDDLAKIAPAKANLKCSLSQKAFEIAGYELRKVLILKEMPKGYGSAEDKRKYEFRVFLSSLVGGDGRSVRLCSALYFKYEDKERFSYFLRCLQTETQLSTIPPIGIPEALPSSVLQTRNTRVGDSMGDGNWSLPSRPSTAGNSSESSHTLAGSSFSTSHTLAGSPTPSQPGTISGPPRRCRRSIRGYTLEDGPWVYRLAKPRGSNNPDTFLEIKDLSSYVKMVETIQEANRSGPDTPETVVIIMHSMDKAARDDWDLKGTREKMEDMELDRDFGDAADDGFDLDGETYSQWLAKGGSCSSTPMR